jgi:hypothetical protein
MTAAFFDGIDKPCPLPPGTRVEVTGPMQDPNPLPVGSQGTVTGGNGSQIRVTWDNGSGLMLLVGEDPYRVIS